VVPGPGPGVCPVCRGPAAAGRGACFACAAVARRLGVPLAPVVPVRLCPLPSPLYTVLLGYKESPVAEARRRFGAIVRSLLCSFLHRDAARLEAAAGGRFDLVLLVPSTHRPGVAPLGHVDGLGREVGAALPAARWVPDLLQRAAVAPGGGSPPVAHMRPDAAAFVPRARERRAVAGARALLLDDTYVSGARAQSAAAVLARAGVRATRIVVIGRVLRPDRVALHAEFLRRHAA
jgi:predicted amidophosphoribosyltransferase